MKLDLTLGTFMLPCYQLVFAGRDLNPIHSNNLQLCQWLSGMPWQINYLGIDHKPQSKDDIALKSGDGLC